MLDNNIRFDNIDELYNYINSNYIIINDIITNKVILDKGKTNYKQINEKIEQIKTISDKIKIISETIINENNDFGYMNDLLFWNFFANVKLTIDCNFHITNTDINLDDTGKQRIINSNVINCIKQYKLKKCVNDANILGEGAFGINCILNKQFGIKYCIKEKCEDLFKNEIDIMFKIKNHFNNTKYYNNILQIHSYYSSIDTHFFIYNYHSKYLSLDKYDNDNIILLDDDILIIIKTLVKVIYHIHNINIIHRDIKLENIIYNKEKKNMILINFDNGFIIENEMYPTKVCGTPEYLDVYRTDIENKFQLKDYWAIGIVIWKLYYGIKSHPFTLDNNIIIEDYFNYIESNYNIINKVIINKVIINKVITNTQINNKLEKIKTISEKIENINDITNFDYIDDLLFWNFFANNKYENTQQPLRQHQTQSKSKSDIPPQIQQQQSQTQLNSKVPLPSTKPQLGRRN